MSSRVSLPSWGEGASSALVGHPSSDGVTLLDWLREMNAGDSCDYVNAYPFLAFSDMTCYLVDIQE